MGGTEVMILGTDFTKVKRVLFGDIPARFVVDTPTRITAIAPPHVDGLIDVRVLTKYGESALTPLDTFTYLGRIAPPGDEDLSSGPGDAGADPGAQPGLLVPASAGGAQPTSPDSPGGPVDLPVFSPVSTRALTPPVVPDIFAPDETPIPAPRPALVLDLGAISWSLVPERRSSAAAQDGLFSGLEDISTLLDRVWVAL